MNRELFKITINGIKGRKKVSILFVIIFTISFAFGIITLSITSSMNRTNEKYRIDTYGAWSVAVDFSDKGSIKTYNGKGMPLEWAKNYGSITVCARILTQNGNEYIGTMDEAVTDIGHLKMIDGRMPQSADEIAVEADVLSELGYDYTLGQNITFDVSKEVIPDEDEEPVGTECTYKLVGVIKEYTRLWDINDDEGYTPLPSAVISDEGYSKLMDSFAEKLDERVKEEPKRLIQLKPSVNIWFLAGEELNDYQKIASKQDDYEAELLKLETGGCIDKYWVNEAAFKNQDVFKYNYIYTAVIFIVMLFAIICVYSIYMHRQIRQTALFRSIGITKRQLGVMTIYENIVLGIPSLILGTVAGAIGTWLILKYGLAKNISDIKLYIPYKRFVVMALLWIGGIILARTVINITAFRQPLTGRMQPTGKNVRRIIIFRKIMILQLSVLFCFVMIFGIFESLYLYSQMNYWNNLPAYKIYSGNQTGEDNIDKIKNMDESFKEQLMSIPGIKSADKMGILEAYLTFDEMWDDKLAVSVWSKQDDPDNGIGVNLCVLPDEKMDKKINDAGVIMTFPTDIDGNILYDDEKYGSLNEYEKKLETVGNITIKLRGQKILTKKLSNAYVDLGEQKLNIKKVMDVSQTSKLLDLGNGEFYNPYTIVCSESYLNELLKKMEPGYMCGTYETGKQSENDMGYNFIDVYAKMDAGYLATDYVAARLCSMNGVQLINNREVYYANAQQYMQNFIMLLSCSICVMIVLVLIMINIITLQMENEKRKYSILKSIGMSNRQIKRKILSESFIGAVIASLCGWAVYLLYLGIKNAGAAAGFANKFETNLYGLRSYGLNAATAGIVTAAGIFMVFIISFVIRRKQWRRS